eukprot:scaffold3464_cov406-Prasinococcus_capsulatus_cf.AAC.1
MGPAPRRREKAGLRTNCKLGAKCVARRFEWDGMSLRLLRSRPVRGAVAPPAARIDGWMDG